MKRENVGVFKWPEFYRCSWTCCFLIVSWWLPFYLSSLFRASGLLFRGSQEVLTFLHWPDMWIYRSITQGEKTGKLCSAVYTFLQVVLNIASSRLKLSSDADMSDLIKRINYCKGAKVTLFCVYRLKYISIQTLSECCLFFSYNFIFVTIVGL